LIGFPENASPDQITEPMIDGLLFMMGPLYYVIVLCGVIFAFMYRIDKQRHEEILGLLEQRRGLTTA
jgi:Na+/melibiose symporter-like transporter